MDKRWFGFNNGDISSSGAGWPSVASGISPESRQVGAQSMMTNQFGLFQDLRNWGLSSWILRSTMMKITGRGF